MPEKQKNNVKQKTKYELWLFSPAVGWHDAGWALIAKGTKREDLDDAIKRHKRDRLAIEKTVTEWEVLQR